MEDEFINSVKKLINYTDNVSTNAINSTVKNYKKKISEGVSNFRNKSLAEKAILSIGNPLNAAMSVFTALPLNAQQALLKVAGLPTKMTEKDLNTAQKKVLYNAIVNAKKEGRNYVKYKDYGKEGDLAAQGNTKNKLGKSLTDANYNIATTLGRGNFKETKDSLIFDDKYDFSKGAFVNTKNPNLYQKFRNYLGESENQNPSVEDINNMKVRIALPKIGTRN